MGTLAYRDIIEDIAAQGAEGSVWFSSEAKERFAQFCDEQGEIWNDREGATALMLICAHVAADLVRRTRTPGAAPAALDLDTVLTLGLWRDGVALTSLPKPAHAALSKWWQLLARAASATRKRPPYEQIRRSISAAIALAIELTVAEPTLLDAEYGFEDKSAK